MPVAGIAIEPFWAGRENMFSFGYPAAPEVVGRYIRAARGAGSYLVDQGHRIIFMIHGWSA
ncbi:hypothetical protein [Frankia nepalensis]|uniref:hypothetical protein n=1 Tax=Frankia nepalensis TaxID=1836974 RepID=UPI001EE3AEEB|nr:hypothetical protein [Frankia nepalensis]